jgi:hypothetical protein
VSIAGTRLAEIFDHPFDGLYLFFDRAFLKHAFRSDLSASRFPDFGAGHIAAFVTALFDTAQVASTGYAKVFAFTFELSFGNLFRFFNGAADFARRAFSSTTGTLVGWFVCACACRKCCDKTATE